MPVEKYFLGCPIWAKKEWVGELFSPRAKAAEYLREYAMVFNAVEGNSTFYALPAANAIAKWCADTPAAFHFCFKFPRRISHECRLRQAQRETQAFLQILQPLQPRLGPLFLQLPSDFGPESFGALQDFLATLPRDFQYAVEIRHPNFYDSGMHEQRLQAVLQTLQIDRVIFDTRALHASRLSDPAIQEAQKRKPKVPVRFTATGARPFVRLVAEPRFPEMEQLFFEWAELFAAWIAAGKTPHMFVHSPDDFLAPRMARVFHQFLKKKCPEVGELPRWPAEYPRAAENQLGLF